MEWHWWVLGIISSVIATCIGSGLMALVGWIGSSITKSLRHISDQIDDLKKNQNVHNTTIQLQSAKLTEIEKKTNKIEERIQSIESVWTHKPQESARD